ncbi:hypothetical protein OHS33_38080 (plasmid) [Streptomyces sp. NBC_00536]|uniref:hypothetical protein n=1 Tax=Streptomyces sp. NBC_00536 TaxID=2975769 RepID=UPI002E81FE31|nr:hypothetical protein [Streptomyces sp. NBC_00536]WUC84211.1 hypothetical protein OHS33_38080 [Streptomyces sp. NBC_00536]
MKNIARLIATATLVGAAVLTAGGVANADGGTDIGWPVAPPTAPAPTPTPNIGWP